MISLILKLIQFSLIIFIVVFTINNSFIISFEFKDLAYSFSSSYFFLLFIFLLVLIFVIQSLYFKSKKVIFTHKINKKIRLKEKGYDAFVNGMMALANKDYKKATLESKKISVNLEDNSPLSLLLRSEIFKLEKKYDQLNVVYEEMLKKESTINLGLRGMMEYFLHMQDYHHAFLYAEKLFNKNPYIEKIYDTLMNILTKTNNWHQLIQITDKAYQKKIIDKKMYQENKSIALYEISKIQRFSDSNNSIDMLLKALNLRPNFPPYVELYVEILIEQKNYKKAKKFMRQTWTKFPYINYKKIIESLAYFSKEDLLQLVKFIVSNNFDQEDSKILFIEASIKNKKWDIARKEITNLLDNKPKKHICLLMAKIEEGDSNDIQKRNAWKMRAESGLESNVWICAITNQAQDEWSSIAYSGYFNSLEWKQPNMLKQINN